MRSVPRRLIGANAVILDEQARVLLVKHSYGRLNWEIPGGLVELDESVVEGACREMREETGLDVVAEYLTGSYYEPANTTGGGMHIFVFLCAKQDPSAVPQPDGTEITECGYWSVDALPRPINDFTIRRITDALAPTNRYPLPATIGPRQWLE